MNNDKMQSMVIQGASNFRFSAVRPDGLGATEYTLVTIVVDTTSSVSGFAGDLKAAVSAVIDSARRSPRADNLLVRLVTFNVGVSEVFGFKSLRDVGAGDVPGFRPQGMTALYDASFEAIGATEQYAKVLYDQDFDANAAVYVITDGEDNRSRFADPAKIADKVSAMRQGEQLESIITVLIGVNTGQGNVKAALEGFAREARFDQFVDVGEASPDRLARLAGFVSKSISAQSQSLGTGGPSQSLSF